MGIFRGHRAWGPPLKVKKFSTKREKLIIKGRE